MEPIEEELSESDMELQHVMQADKGTRVGLDLDLDQELEPESDVEPKTESEIEPEPEPEPAHEPEPSTVNKAEPARAPTPVSRTRIYSLPARLYQPMYHSGVPKSQSQNQP